MLIITRDGGKQWSKDHHLVVVKFVKNVAFSLKNGERKLSNFLKNDKNKNKNIQFLYKFKMSTQIYLNKAIFASVGKSIT